MAKIALLIGVSEYEPGLNPLPGSVKDVDAMQRVLAHPEMGDFAEADITVLKNPQRQQMEDAIYRLFSDRKKDDLLLLYFSGHGIKDERGKLYLATCGTRRDSRGRLVKPSAVATAFLHESINESRSQRQVIILDCCFSGAIAEGMTVKDDGAVNLQEQLGGRGRAILTSSSTTEYSFGQGAETSIYTRYLIEGIEKGAADQDEDGWISADELHEYASAKVRETAPAMTPKFYPTEEGYKIFLAKSPKDDPKLKYRKEAESRAGQGKFSIFARKMLDRKRIEWGLSLEEATAIENEVLQPYREYERNLGEYEQALIEAVGIEYPFNEDVSKDLKDYQKSLGLQDEDVASIEQRVLAFTQAVEAKTTLGREGRVILTSTSSVQYNFVETDSNLLPYTRRLIEGIETGEADLDNDGWISVDELHEYARNQLTQTFPTMTPKFFPIKEGFRILIAKSPKKTSKTKVTGKIALLIGVSEYEHGSDWNLPSHCGKDDVAALAKVLQNSAKGDFEDVQTLIDPEPTQMQEAIEIFFSEADKGNLVLLYFAGIGVKGDNGNFYFTTRITRKNSRGSLIKATAVSASFIHEAMQSSKARRQIIIIDSSFSGAFARGLSAE